MENLSIESKAFEPSAASPPQLPAGAAQGYAAQGSFEDYSQGGGEFAQGGGEFAQGGFEDYGQGGGEFAQGGGYPPDGFYPDGGPSDWGGEYGEEYGEGAEPGPPAPTPGGPCVTLPALSFRQPFASLVLYGVKQLEPRNRPQLRGLVGSMAIHISHKEEPYGSPLVSTAVQLLRRRFPDEQIAQLFALPQSHANAHGCIVGLVDVEATWPADLFNDVEQAQLSEQAVYPVGGTFVTQLRNPRWLKYPVRTSGSNRVWNVQVPLDALPDGTELGSQGELVCAAARDVAPRYQPGSCAQSVDMAGDDLGLGLLGDEMLGALTEDSGKGEDEKKLKKLQKAIRAIEELKAKLAGGTTLEKTQLEKIEKEDVTRAELAELQAKMGSG